ncbi:hypothetical protein [Aeromicrobium ginsengisoli]|uniref:Uncharacterized protein n=1 Tax=Aeromicrobium ginsengisoli TaxID=363867 RepID=A0A5M4FI59_9ACTN|nr:hypothetical protein [Aeromicrobium ginsengisoli]KAA1399909.1 hypothetical protein ESP70_003905 [Aeromicrobium ginsengisoli]
MPQDQLVERRDGFNYGYRMRCECGRSSLLSARDYADEINEAHLDCEHCGAGIHFGRAVIAIRDEHDLALDDEMVSRFAWYHTSTWPNWPSPDYANQTKLKLKESAGRLGFSVERALEKVTTQAFHLGTYEAAVENMFRRMRDQADGGAQFHLYRVKLRPGLRIEEGYRDENLDEAAQLTVPELEASGVDVVRYLNAHEAEGTLSVAVQPDALASVQQIAVPVAQLADEVPGTDPVGASDVVVAQRESDQASAMLRDVSVYERRLMKFGLRPDPDGLGRVAADRQMEVYEKWTAFEDELARLYMPDISPMVVVDFQQGLRSWRGAVGCVEPDRFSERVSQMAALVTEPEKVIRLLSQQSWRAIGRGA